MRERQSLTLLTYNTHSAVGTDGAIAPERIADVLSECDPDIICLQELDIGLRRTGSVDQAQYIACQLKMSYHFHPALHIAEGQYGNAVLTRFPMRLVRAGALPGLPQRSRLEKRGAVWVEVLVQDRPVQIVTVHMGLNRRERLAQAVALTGPEWVGAPECKLPVILCGDLNALPASPVHRLFRANMRDAHLAAGRPQATWPSKCAIARIDYIYVSKDVIVRDCTAHRSRLARLASDHLPLLARLEITEPEGMRFTDEEDT